MIKTKLHVFDSDSELSFDVNTPQFLKEAAENCEHGMYAVCWNIFKALLAQVAERATELHDPILDTLMIRLGLYEIPPSHRRKVVEKLKNIYNQSLIKS